MGFSQVAGETRKSETSETDMAPLPTLRLGTGRKFMQTLDDYIFRELETIADARGVTIQGLIRAVIIPDWITVKKSEDDFGGTSALHSSDVECTTELGASLAAFTTKTTQAISIRRQTENRR